MDAGGRIFVNLFSKTDALIKSAVFKRGSFEPPNSLRDWISPNCKHFDHLPYLHLRFDRLLESSAFDHLATPA